MRATFILNPAAQGGRTGRLVDAVRAEAARAGIEADVVQTTHPRHAVALAQAAAEGGAEAVVAVGGDGTVHEVAEGLTRASVAVPLGIVPLGTGNDLAKMVGAAPGGKVRPWAEALRALPAAPVRAVDVGWVRWRETAGGPEAEAPFFNSVGVGFDARVAVEAPRFKKLGGTLAYLAAIVSVLGRWDAPHLTATTDAGDVLLDGPFFLATAGNGVASGGAFFLTPDARIDDGLLDMCLVDALPLRRIVTLIPQVMRGQHTHEPEVHLARTTGLTLAISAPCAIHADGEIVARAARHVQIGLRPGALRVLG